MTQTLQVFTGTLLVVAICDSINKCREVRREGERETEREGGVGKRERERERGRERERDANKRKNRQENVAIHCKLVM